MSQFTQAAANTMSRENPGFGGFMNNMMNRGAPDPPMGAPPGPPQEYKNQPPIPPRTTARYPDIGMTRGSPKFNDAVNMEHMQDPFKSDRERKRKKRPEMKGPSDLDDILAGLKTKKINLQKQADEKSVVSIDDIKELKNGKTPKRKSRSNQVTMSLNGLV